MGCWNVITEYAVQKRRRASSRDRLAQAVGGLVALCLLVILGFPNRAFAEGFLIERVELEGLHRTRESTLLDLLPRAAPALFQIGEIQEFERRVGNLEIFDSVSVTIEQTILKVEVREKWSLVPEFDLATGTSFEDTYVLLGLTEYNFLGLAASLGLSVYHEQRGWGFYLVFQEHVYRRKRWAFGAETSYETADYRFRDGASWATTQGLGSIWTTSTPLGSDHVRLEIGLAYTHQKLSEFMGEVRPPDGHALANNLTFTLDHSTWHDLVPRGFQLNLSFRPGLFLHEGGVEARVRADLEGIGSMPLSRHTALMIRVAGGVVTRGNPNYSLLIGSAEGVRGLEDAWYFTWAQAFSNIELRQSIPLGARWALQAVLLADIGGFERIDSRGARDLAHMAFSGGGGVRIVPTWISGLVPRFDVTRLVTPNRSFFYQFGVSQYF